MKPRRIAAENVGERCAHKLPRLASMKPLYFTADNAAAVRGRHTPRDASMRPQHSPRIITAMGRTIDQKTVTYDFARMMEGAKEFRLAGLEMR